MAFCSSLVRRARLWVKVSAIRNSINAAGSRMSLCLEKAFLPHTGYGLPGNSILVFYQLDTVVLGYFGKPYPLRTRRIPTFAAEFHKLPVPVTEKNDRLFQRIQPAWIKQPVRLCRMIMESLRPKLRDRVFSRKEPC